ncbi:CPBP family intramembrane glutamic endopeptidase [Actinomadura sp. HBU206391]|uniref:CPBP family intramembrane glutamic endopeptidase n=1 Tax=Actinomadura sp. HBU206391 TaxID=2731692 RepID=UPI00164EDDB8|nr:CPBP family intramembrane glutamic endopeptidase [Actinomadura sp. HBU206391]MBC6458336.1 CPBP family intramembrane metalloprotease [Actinomadura sp. HBU206391]
MTMRQGTQKIVPTDRAVLDREVVLVLALSLGASGVSALISFVGSLTASRPLSRQTAQLITDHAPGRPWLGLAWQLFSIATALVPVALVAHLMARSGESLSGTLGFSLARPARDLLRGAAVAAVIGGSGLGLYLFARQIRLNLTVVPSSLDDVWWRIPVLVAAAAQNAVLEETIVLGYLVHRLDQRGWSPWRSTAASSLLRGSYHLYQGVGGFVGNVVMGVIFCWLYRRWGRVMPLVVAHALIDIVAFVGAVLLAGKVGWLPAG